MPIAEFSTTESEELEEELPVLPFKRNKQDVIRQSTDSTDKVLIEKEEYNKGIENLKDVVVENVIDDEYNIKEKEYQKEDKKSIEEDELVKPIKSIEEM